MINKLIIIVLFSINFKLLALNMDTLIVAKDGSGNFKTLTEAIESLPMFNYQRITVFIKKGVYNEKIKLSCDYITLCGEDKDSVIIKYSQLRSDWSENKDSIGPAVININGDDIILNNITIINSQEKIGPHAFAILGFGTRTIITNCNIISKGGDTVALWNYKTGMYYHSNCYFEGAVDFVCPRGWCFIKNSKFYEIKNSAAIWHAGGFDKSQKFVIKNSEFDGAVSFSLGRHHYDAQFFLIQCKLSDKIRDKNIYRVTYDDTTRNQPFNWGKRYYYYGIEKYGDKFEWLKDDITSEEVKEITAAWSFDNKWNPESKEALLPEIRIEKNIVILEFKEIVGISGTPILTLNGKFESEYFSGAGSKALKFKSKRNLENIKLKNIDIKQGKVSASKAGVYERSFVSLAK